MAQTAAHFVDNVLPFVPFRQVVLTVPKRIRFEIVFSIEFLLFEAVHESKIKQIFLWKKLKNKENNNNHRKEALAFG